MGYLGFEEDGEIQVLSLVRAIQRGNIAKQIRDRARLDRQFGFNQIFQTVAPAPAYAKISITISTLAPFRLSVDRNHQREHRFCRRYRWPGNHRAAIEFELCYGHAPAGPRRHLLKSEAQVPTHRQNRNAVAPRSPSADPFRSKTCSLAKTYAPWIDSDHPSHRTA